MKRIFLLAILTLATAAPAHAQADVRAAIDRLFDGMRAGDSTAVRAVLHPEARMFSVTATGLRAGNVDAFVRAVGTPHDQVWDEQISNVEIRVDGGLATAWMDYRFVLGGTPSHCGVNAFQLVRGDAGWQVLQVTDTRRPC